MKIKRTREDIIIDTVIIISLLFLAVITLYPFINLAAISLNDATDTVRGGIYLWPRKFTLYNYKNVLSDSTIFTATLISAARTILGTVLSLIATVIVAYILSKKDFVLRKFLNTFLVLTMYFSGGLIPQYFLFRQLNLIDNFTVYIIPALLSAFNVIITRSYIEGLPESLIESATIDGANDGTVLASIVFPLITPVVATVALFVAVGQWNSWFDTYIFVPNNTSISTLQFELMKKLQSVMQNIASQQTNFAAQQQATSNTVTPDSIRATMTIVATIPILVVYPFLQKYFVTGLTLGGVKG